MESEKAVAGAWREALKVRATSIVSDAKHVIHGSGTGGMHHHFVCKHLVIATRCCRVSVAVGRRGQRCCAAKDYDLCERCYELPRAKYCDLVDKRCSVVPCAVS